jgi:hypothetical protein
MLLIKHINAGKKVYTAFFSLSFLLFFYMYLYAVENVYIIV